MKDLKSLIQLLSDGEYHSGESLGAALGVSRAAVWKRLQQLAPLGIPLESSKGVGYRIPAGLDLLDRQAIMACMGSAARKDLADILLFDQIDSTNGYLLNGDFPSGTVCLAETQSSGRGRRGRDWHSPYGRNLYFSIVWQFHQGVATLEGLSLAVGVVLAETVTSLGVGDVRLKWPNDLLREGCKLGGVLIEVGGDLSGECRAVIGVGLNVRMSDGFSRKDAAHISQPWTDLKAGGFEGTRNMLCGHILDRLLPAFHAYPEQRFGAFRARWESFSAFQNKQVQLVIPGTSITGKLLGIDDQGAVHLLVEGCERVFRGGEISLRGCDDH